MSAPTNTDVDPKNLEIAMNTWHGFTKAAKYGCIAVATILILMRIFLV